MVKRKCAVSRPGSPKDGGGSHMTTKLTDREGGAETKRYCPKSES